jgi:hypothetical protein
MKLNGLRAISRPFVRKPFPLWWIVGAVLAACFLTAALTLMPLLFFAGLPPTVRANGTKAGDVTQCQLTVPPNPLSAQGLMTPWMLQAPCHEANPAQSVFVQAVIFDPATKSLAAYEPLVVDAGSAPAAPPTPITLPQGAVVGIFGGGNDDSTTLIGATAGCVFGFGQVFFCNTHHLFSVVSSAHMRIPTLGVGADNLPCPTVRDFRIVDQDQSDNVQTLYLALPDGQTMQDTAANRAANPQAVVLANGSDNSLLLAVDGALGCQPWMIPDLADGGNPVPTQATDELQAAAYQQAPVALIPAGDPMVGPNNLFLLNQYRVHVDQPAVGSLQQADTTQYCANLVGIQDVWLAHDQTIFAAATAPAFLGGGPLYDFLLARYQATLNLLNCPIRGYGRQVATGDGDHHNHDAQSAAALRRVVPVGP